jgi:glycosyltransferase involved in cell wall biosynthesis
VRLLFVAPRYRPHVGGVERVVEALASRAAALGHEVVVLAGEPGVDRPREEVAGGVWVVRWPVYSPGGAYHVPRRRGDLEAWLGRVGAEVVHIHGAHAVFTVYVGERAAGRARVVFSPHYHGGGHTAFRDLLWRLYWRRAVARLVEGSDVVHVVSPVEAGWVLAHFPRVAGKLAVVPNGVEGDVVSYRWRGADSGYAVYGGRLEGYKRLLEAADLVRGLGLRFVVVGEGPMKRRLAGLRGVEVRPFLPRGEFLDLVAGARYAVNLSVMEAFSVFIAEALAMGVPSLVSDVVARALGAVVVGRLGGALVATGAPVKTWDELMPRFLKLYG